MHASNSSIGSLLEGSRVFVIPLFQRRYSWARTQWRALWNSVCEQYEFELTETSGQLPVNHFIGSFVLSPVPGTQNPPTRILVVDGQQRLITISVLLAALRDLRWQQADDPNVRHWLEEDFTKAYLLNSILNPTPETRSRVLPTQEDRQDYASTITDTPSRPQGKIGEAYRYFLREARGVDSSGVNYDLERMTNVILGRLSLVDIRTQPGDNVHRVFQTLNSGGVSLKQVDLLRNHFFMLLPSRAERLYQEVWRDMELRLGESTMDKFFWASLVSQDPRVSRKTVFSTMQERLARDGIEFNEDRVESILRQLNEDSKQYLKLTEPGEEARSPIRLRLTALDRWGTDTYYPLGLALLNANASNRMTDVDLADCLLYIESYLVRRMLVGVPTNNLNRIFSALTGSVPLVSIKEWLYQSLSQPARFWPGDRLVEVAVQSLPFSFSGQPHQRTLIFEQIDGFLREDSDGITIQGIEDLGGLTLRAVMPSTPSAEWPLDNDQDIEDAQSSREKIVHTMGNQILVPKMSAPRAEGLQDLTPWLRKLGFAVNSAVANTGAWAEPNIRARSAELGRAVLDIWPGPRSSSRVEEEAPRISDDVVLLLPQGGYTTVPDLAEYWSLDEKEVSLAIQKWPRESAARVALADGSFGSDTKPEVLGATEPLTRRFKASDLGRLAEEEDAQNLEQSEA